MRFCLTRRRRALAAISAFGFLLSLLAACASANTRQSPEQAFALSASALSGSDNFSFDGELSIYDPLGAVANRSQFSGKVTGHGQLNIQWKGEPMQAGQTAGKSGRYQPLRLLEAIQSRRAIVAYADQPARKGVVQLRIDLQPETAKARVAGELRAGLAALREEWSNKELKSDERRQAQAILDRAERRLEETLATLSVQTRCLWLADGKTWFPLRMSEHTELTYVRAGKTYREKREAVTRFLPSGRDGTIRKPAPA